MASKRTLWAVLISIGCSCGTGPGEPSRSSLLTAACRAIGATHPIPELRNPDYLAAKFLGRTERTLLADGAGEFVQALEGDKFAVNTLRDQEIIRGIFIRTKYIDSVMEQALNDGVQQIVVLGAGLDSRGYRFAPRLQGIRFFEVDQPATLEHKKLRVMEVFGTLPGHIRYVAIDFTRQDTARELSKGGYGAELRSLFIWEGVTMYLPRSAIEGTLTFVREHSGAGSTIVFDYYLSSYPSINNPNTVVARWGEPIVFGFPGSGAADLVRQAGLEVISDYKRSELNASFVTNVDRARMWSMSVSAAANSSGICHARVPFRR